MKTADKHIVTIGFMQRYETPIDDYVDFLHLSQSTIEVEKGLRLGHLPPGLILKDRESGTTAQVVGEYGKAQTLKRMT